MTVEIGLTGFLVLLGAVALLSYYVNKRLKTPQSGDTIEDVKDTVLKETVPEVSKEAEDHAKQDISNSDGFVDWWIKQRRSGK